MLGEQPVTDHSALGAHGQAHEEEVALGRIHREPGQRGKLLGHVEPVPAYLMQALHVLRPMVLEHEHHMLGEGVEVPLGEHRADAPRERGVGDEIAEPYAVQAEVLAKAAQHDDVGPQHRLLHHRRLRLRVGELQERLVDDDQVEIGHGVHELHDGVPVQEPAVGVVGVADHGGTGAAGPDELGVLREVEGEAAGLLEREHVDPLAGLHGLVGPAAEGGDGDGEGFTDQQVVDPGDQLGRAVAHRDGLRGELEEVAQLGRDGVGAAGVVRDDVAQPARHVVEHGGRGEVRVAGDAEVDRPYPVTAFAGQRGHRRAVRRRAAEQRGDVLSQGNLRVWVARAGEHGPPLDTDACEALFNPCENVGTL